MQHTLRIVFSTLACAVAANAQQMACTQSVAACTQKAAAVQGPEDIVGTAKAAGSFRTLLAAVDAAGLTATLQGKGPFTVFAPTDAAFAKLGKQKIAELLLPANKAQLTAILKYHVVAGNLPAAKVAAASELASLQGSPLAVQADAHGVTVAGARVAQADVTAANGVIHVVDSVLLPPADLVATAAKAGKFATLLAAATAAGLADTLAKDGPFTVFAPTDEAFAKLGKDTLAELLLPANKDKLAAILKYHVVAGAVRAAEVVKAKSLATLQGGKLAVRVADGKVQVGTAGVVATDVIAGNGVIHVIDSVLLPH